MTYSTYLKLSVGTEELYQALFMTSVWPRELGVEMLALLRAPSDPIAIAEMTEYILSPSATASSRRRRTNEHTASAGTMPSDRWSNGLQCPEGERIW